MNRWARGVAALSATCVAACTGSLFQSKVPPPTIYVLSAELGSPAGAGPSAAESAARLPVGLAVLVPRLRPGLATDRIAVLYPDRRLDYFADARWSGPLGEVLQDLAVQEFHLHGNVGVVSGDASVFASAYWLEIEVSDFQAEYAATTTAAPKVRVQVLATLGSSADRRILGQFAASVLQPAAENRLTAIVDAYAHAADAAFAQIVAHVDDTLARSSEAR
jgi:cholesterol transport system auxiliary component